MLTVQQTQALYKLYPQAIRTIDDTAYDAEGNQVDYDLAAVTEQAAKDQCKQDASKRLFDTDWTTIADVANPVNSPYLSNQADFIVYRNAVRKLAVNPVVDPVFPDKPNEIWK